MYGPALYLDIFSEVYPFFVGNYSLKTFLNVPALLVHSFNETESQETCMILDHLSLKLNKKCEVFLYFLFYFLALSKITLEEIYTVAPL
jgi:hypothetical protein